MANDEDPISWLGLCDANRDNPPVSLLFISHPLRSRSCMQYMHDTELLLLSTLGDSVANVVIPNTSVLPCTRSMHTIFNLNFTARTVLTSYRALFLFRIYL